MSSIALIIDKSLISEEHSCKICNDIIVDDTIIGLLCNPSKHIFCYTCILDWYKTLKKQTSYGNYSNMNMCPICMKNGGKLPICDNVEYINGIHKIKPIKKVPVFPLCGTPLKSNPAKTCSLIGRYNGKCCTHKAMADKVSIVETDVSVKSPFLVLNIYCNAPLKSKKGEKCKSYGKFNGRCGRHKSIPIEVVDISINETDNAIVI
jgi:hypothetical protein